MNHMAVLLKKDIILGIKDIFVILELAFAVFMLIFLAFIVPERIDSDTPIFIYDETGFLSEWVAGLPLGEAPELADVFVESREALSQGLEENNSAVGMSIGRAPDGSTAVYEVELLVQPYMNQKMIDAARVDILDLLSVISPPAGLYPRELYDLVRVEALQTGLKDEIPFNLRLLPMVLMVMVGILGLFIMVSLLGQERADLTIRAFRVTPGGIWAFIGSKHLMVLLTGFTTFSIIYLPLLGFTGYLQSLLIIALTIVIGSSIGAILAAYFDNPMGSIGWVFLIMLVFNLPAISLLAPVFSPPWLQLIPSFHTLFGLDAAMFPDGNQQLVWRSMAILALTAAILYPLSSLIFARRIWKEN